MAINPVTGKVNNGLLTPTTAGKKEPAANSAKVEGGSSQGQVEVAAIAEQIKHALESTSSASVVDFDKVAKVKQALLSGQYEINADSIAEKMLNLDRHLDST